MRIKLCGGEVRAMSKDGEIVDINRCVFSELTKVNDVHKLDDMVHERFFKNIPGRIDLIVNGKNILLCAVIRYALKNDIWLVLWHYNEKKDLYNIPQTINICD